ncbi:MAG: LptF/LptG family permease, partial [Bacteroidota bacterium]|nr:LptF/LptG family permease [Bacteroidota bacterium]
NMFSALFTFITVIFFTSKMASDTEIVAILSSGISFKRFLRPFIIAASLIGILSFILSNFVIPHTNEVMMDFRWKYIKNARKVENRNIHMQVSPELHTYVETYNKKRDLGRKFCLESINKDGLVSKLTADYIKWDSASESWGLNNYVIRTIDGMEESFERGSKLDTIIPLKPLDFIINLEDVKSMDWWELRAFIEKEKLKGSGNVSEYEIEKHKRIAFPFANIILTIIGVAISSRKVRGGIGMHLGIGITLTFSYLLFMQISTVFASYGSITPFMAVWIPNIVFAIISFFLLKIAPK